MIGMNVRTIDESGKVIRASRRDTVRVLYKASGFIRTVARRSIKKKDTPAAPGKPPHTQTKRLRKAILFEVDRATQTSVVGPSADVVGIAGAEHEHGGRFRRESFKPRPFMRPAFEKTRPMLPRFWDGVDHY